MIGAYLAKKAARDAFTALNHHDLDAFMAAWDEHAEFEFPGTSAPGGRFAGRGEIRAWFQTWWDRFPTTLFTIHSISVEHPMALGGNNTIHVEWELNETDQQGHHVHTAGVTALRARGGKVVHVRDYIFSPEVIAAAWSGLQTTA
jgi:ketosteroid isomerase-like protein